MSDENRRAPIRSGRMAFYLFLAAMALGLAIYVLAREPDPGFPINMIHLLFRD